MAFEQYIGTRDGRKYNQYTFPAVRICRNKKWGMGGQRQTCSLVFYKAASEKFEFKKGDRITLYFDRDSYCLGVRKGAIGNSVGLKLTSADQRSTDGYNGLRVSIPGLLKVFDLGEADINGSYELTQNEDGMLVINLNEKLKHRKISETP